MLPERREDGMFSAGYFTLSSVPTQASRQTPSLWIPEMRSTAELVFIRLNLGPTGLQTANQVKWNY